MLRKVDVAPAQAEDFAETEAIEQRNRERQVEPVSLGCLQKAHGFLGIPRFGRFGIVGLQFDQLGDITKHQLLTLSPRYSGAECDSPAVVHAKVTWQVRRLLSRVPTDDRKRLVAICFNLEGEQDGIIPGNLTERQEWIRENLALGGRSGLSKSTIQRYLNAALDAFCLELERNPPPPVPEEVIARLRTDSELPVENIKQAAANHEHERPNRIISTLRRFLLGSRAN